MVFCKKFIQRYGKQLLSTAIKTELDAPKTASKKVAHKAAEATSEFIGSKIPDKFVKPKSVAEMIIPLEKREEILNELRQVL